MVETQSTACISHVKKCQRTRPFFSLSLSALGVYRAVFMRGRRDSNGDINAIIPGTKSGPPSSCLVPYETLEDRAIFHFLAIEGGGASFRQDEGIGNSDMEGREEGSRPQIGRRHITSRSARWVDRWMESMFEDSKVFRVLMVSFAGFAASTALFTVSFAIVVSSINSSRPF